MGGKAIGVLISGDAVSGLTQISGYTPHSSGATPVTSNAATDLDTTAAQVDTLNSAVQLIIANHNALLASLRAKGIIDT